MSVPYFPMYPADFEADTSHLTLEEDGAYNRLLRLMWMTPGCSLPDDPAWIARRMRVTPSIYSAVIAPLIAEFFKRSNGRVYSPRLRKEWEKVDETSRRRSEAGKKGGRPKAIENKQEQKKAGFDFDKAGPKQPEPEPEPYREDRPKGLLSHRDECAEAVAAYNESAEAVGWPRVQVLSKSRRSAIKQRLAECGGISGWRDALARARASPHLCGQNDRGWTASFDFLTQASSFAKLMEGNYDPRHRSNSQRTPEGSKRADPALEQIARLAGLGPASGDGRGGAGGFGEEAGPLWMGTRPQ